MNSGTVCGYALVNTPTIPEKHFSHCRMSVTGPTLRRGQDKLFLDVFTSSPSHISGIISTNSNQTIFWARFSGTGRNPSAINTPAGTTAVTAGTKKKKIASKLHKYRSSNPVSKKRLHKQRTSTTQQTRYNRHGLNCPVTRTPHHLQLQSLTSEFYPLLSYVCIVFLDMENDAVPASLQGSTCSGT